MFVFDIKRYSINDGPGIRITVFLKGCPLTCAWCHNPEGMSTRQEKLFTRTRCISCGRCVAACPEGAIAKIVGEMEADLSKCTLCGKCIFACPTRAMEFAAKNMSVEEIMIEVEKERVFFEESGGGLTVCGGEPLMHYKDLIALLKESKRRGIHTAVDTTLYTTSDILHSVITYTDLFLVDLKHMNSEIHKKFCGMPNELILGNIEILSKKGAQFIVRIPVIEGVNADLENMEASANFLSKQKALKVELLAYHDIAKGKHDRLGTIYNPNLLRMSTPTEEKMQRVMDIFQSRNIDCRLG